MWALARAVGGSGSSCTHVGLHERVHACVGGALQISEPSHSVTLWTVSSSFVWGEARGVGTCPGFRGSPWTLPSPFCGVPRASQALLPPCWPRLPSHHVGWHRHWQRPMQGLHHTGGTPGSGLQPGPTWYHQPVCHWRGWQPHGCQHLPQRVGQPAGGSGGGRCVHGGPAQWPGGDVGRTRGAGVTWLGSGGEERAWPNLRSGPLWTVPGATCPGGR